MGFVSVAPTSGSADRMGFWKAQYLRASGEVGMSSIAAGAVDCVEPESQEAP